ncbi:MAG: type II toxin-antitoxin system RelE/ParE family toxin [Pyrinomonadaceae bacterium]|nr:type II toxin-antitoxin system RelE/ParE family toxin [Pyrinomonadaceae bacterium]
MMLFDKRESGVEIQKINKRTVRISVDAIEDLKDIWEYVSQYNENSANKLIKEIKNKFVLLRDNPLIGREQNDLLVGLRSYVVKKYFIFYSPFSDGINISRILHSSRDVESIFENFFDSL